MDGDRIHCVTVFLVGFRLVVMLAFPTLAAGAWLIVRKHLKMFELWGLSLIQKVPTVGCF